MARPRTFDEATVVEAARDRFWTTGYAATSLDDLVKATGLAKGSLYHAFGDKHALYLRAFTSYCAAAVEEVSGVLDGPDATAADRLRDLVHRIARAGGTSATVPRCCFLMKATAELGALDEEVSAIAARTFTQLEDVLVRCVAAAQRAGDVRASRDPRSAARHALVVLRGMEALASAGVDQDVLADAEAELVGSMFGVDGR